MYFVVVFVVVVVFVFVLRKDEKDSSKLETR